MSVLDQIYRLIFGFVLGLFIGGWLMYNFLESEGFRHVTVWFA